MSTTKTQTEAAEQNSLVNSLIEQVTGRFSDDSESIHSDPELDWVFMILSNYRRRSIICLLSDVGGGITISELAERIAAAEEGVDRNDLSTDARKRLYVSCYQTHLPKLEEENVVSVDYDRNVVTPSENHSTLLAVLRKTGSMIR
jgi:DNA-binding transcriptional ArsR family regulator